MGWLVVLYFNEKLNLVDYIASWKREKRRRYRGDWRKSEWEWRKKTTLSPPADSTSGLYPTKWVGRFLLHAVLLNHLNERFLSRSVEPPEWKILARVLLNHLNERYLLGSCWTIWMKDFHRLPWWTTLMKDSCQGPDEPPEWKIHSRSCWTTWMKDSCQDPAEPP